MCPKIMFYINIKINLFHLYMFIYLVYKVEKKIHSRTTIKLCFKLDLFF